MLRLGGTVPPGVHCGVAFAHSLASSPRCGGEFLFDFAQDTRGSVPRYVAMASFYLRSVRPAFRSPSRIEGDAVEFPSSLGPFRWSRRRRAALTALPLLSFWARSDDLAGQRFGPRRLEAQDFELASGGG